MALFPFFGDTKEEEQEQNVLPMCKEVAWDFSENVPILENGDYKIVFGKDAVKTWAYKALKTERFHYLIYSFDYGTELQNLIGKNYTPSLTKAESIRYVEETLLINPYIQNISDVEVRFEGTTLFITGILHTIYGDAEMGVNV